MSSIPSDLKYASSHEWVRVNGDGTITVGISDHAQSQLGDLVYVEVPEIGAKLNAGSACAVVESVKAAADVYRFNRDCTDHCTYSCHRFLQKE